MDEPVAPRHRRRERRRTQPDPAAVDATPSEYAAAPATLPAEPARTGAAAPPATRPADRPCAGGGAADRGAAPDAAGDDGPGRDEAEPQVWPPRAAPTGPPPAPDQPAVVRRVKKARKGDAERGLRGIVGAGPSQVTGASAMRARDAARPTAADLAAAERDVVIVHRHYVPPDALPGAR